MNIVQIRISFFTLVGNESASPTEEYIFTSEFSIYPVEKIHDFLEGL